MQPNDPNKSDVEDNEVSVLPSQPAENEVIPGAPELPSDSNEADVSDAKESGNNEAPENTQNDETNTVGESLNESQVSSEQIAPVATQPEVEQPKSVDSLISIVPPTDRKKGKKKFALFAVIIAALLIGGGGAGAYFGLYLPSQPENIWKSAMTNSGKVYDEAVAYAIKDREDKAMRLEGSYDVDGAVESDGKISGEWKGLDGKINGELSAAGLKIGFDARTIKATDDSADLYFKLSGLQGLGTLAGGGQIGEAINGVNNQWFVIDHTLVEQAVAAGGEEYSKEDVAALLEKAGVPTKEYLLSSDPQKAVFEVREQIGSEKKEGRNTYHFKVGYNNDNFGKYVEALCSAVKDDKIGKVLLENEKKSCSDLGKDAANQKTDQTADVWVDKRTKLPHIVRISDPKNAESWVEIGQDYQGGDEFPMTIKLRSKEDKQNLEVDIKAVVNTKTDAATLDGTFSMKGSSSQGISGKVSVKLTQSSDASVKVDKPENAKSIIELMNSLGLGELIGNLRGGSDMTLPSSLEIEDVPQLVQ